jgi:nicotinamidase-related amidase
MTTPTPATPTPANRSVVLDCDEAAELAGLLDLIEDWLHHADDDARADLAGYLDGSGHGRLAAAGLAACVEHTAITLHRRLRKATTR